MTPRGYYNAPPQQEPRPFVLIDMPVRQPETLLRGLRVDLHASTLPNVDEHTVLHVVLIKDKPPLLRGPYRPRTSEQHSSSSLSPRQIIGGPMRPSRLQRGAKYLGLDWSQKPLDARFISTEARQKLTAFLERAVGADIQLLFAKDPYDVVWLDYVCGRNDDDEEDEIHAHACVLGTVESDSMQRLLTTLPPEEEEKGNFKDDSVSDHEPAESENVTVASHHGTSTAGNNSRGTNINTANNNSMIPSSPPPPLIDQPQEPIRSIRFEDSPPAVVRAVVRYIYLGERPVVEANCGYTVKDLMALATFLEIEPLEEYCVALVLGLSPDCCCCESEEHELMLCSNYSSSSSSASSSSLGARWWRQRTTRAESENESLRSKWAPATKTTMMPRESMLQTLFAWGYRFPRIERALIRELVSDLGKILSNREAKILDRFKTHEAFERILVEMMKEQVLQRN
ncbi:hypothetical protein BGZ83_011979 [Gryganskiella cystojenkinii]|nr:hypothetical protein BGZ83_011979 [Gryganskiella cystojenkinii]